MEYNKKRLENGATLITVPLKSTSSVTIFIGFPVGSRYESKRINGASHFIEHMMFKGTKRRPTTKDISMEIDGAGAQWNAFTSKEVTAYYIKIDSARLEEAGDLWEDVLFHSKFDTREFEKEKGVINEELRMYEDTPLRDVQEEFEVLMHEGSALGYKIGGTPDIINALKRVDLIKYRDKFYHHNKMVVCVAGNYSEKQIDFIEKLFAKGNKKGAMPKFQLSRPGKSKVNVRLKYKDTDQVHIALGFPAYKKGDKRLLALSLLQNIMGGTMSSRLFREVREKRGLAYSVRTDIEAYRDCGNTYVHAGLHTQRIDQAVEVIVRELKKVAEKGVTSKELKYAKGNARGGTILALEDSSAVANYFAGQQLLLDKIKTPGQKLEELEKATCADVQKVAKEIFDFKKVKMAVIGPFKDKKKFEKLLM